MTINDYRRDQAEKRQWAAASDISSQVRLLAGPGTGKTNTIVKRVEHLLTNGVNPDNIYVISFTRAASADIKIRIQESCSTLSCSDSANQVHVSTMHSLALRILRRANLLATYPSSIPVILDDWEQTNIYDQELASNLGCTKLHAAKIRKAHDAKWHTLESSFLNQPLITTGQIKGFNAFHSSRTNLYSCLLPGEVIFKCVDAFSQGTLQPHQRPHIDHLIVDEYQDLNKCDQEFIHLLCQNGTILFIAGDDDQSIYLSLRHANPDGIIQFQNVYQASNTHILEDSFRCTPEVLLHANKLITYNPNRIDKKLISIYSDATPPVRGCMKVWSFRTNLEEARSIAQSCQELINAGMAGQEDKILILLSNRKVQLDILKQELSARDLPFDPPHGDALTSKNAIRAIFSLIRITKDNNSEDEDYPAHRDLLKILSGVGDATAVKIAEACILNNQNYRQLFYLKDCPLWLDGRSKTAVRRVMSIVNAARLWKMSDTMENRRVEIISVLKSQVFTKNATAISDLNEGGEFLESMPEQMNLKELYLYLAADNETAQQDILNAVYQRIGNVLPEAETPIQKRIKILTMHGAKGLTGKVVFIPGAEQGLIPSFKAQQVTGMLIESRRLFYVSVTRAMVCCIASHVNSRTGAQAKALTQKYEAHLARSQFINEMGLRSVLRNSGLSAEEASEIISEINNL